MKRLSVDGALYFLAACCLMVLPLGWVLGAALAAGFHEICHLAAIYLSGGTIRGIHLGPGGAVINMEPMESGREVLCAAAGPAGSLLLTIFSESFPELALCGFVQGCFNLLPIYPMDGGRILKCALAVLLPEKAERLTCIIGAAASCLLVIFCAYWNYLPGIVIFGAWFLGRWGKISCKEGNLAVQ